MRIPIQLSAGVAGEAVAWGNTPRVPERFGAGGNDLLVILSPRPYAPGQPLSGALSIDGTDIPIEARTVDCKRQPDGRFEVRTRVVNLRKEHRASLDVAARSAALLFPSLAQPTDAFAIHVGAARWSYAQLAGRVRAYIDALQPFASMNDRLCVWTHGSIDTITALIGNAYAGCVSVPLNPAIGDDELRHILEHSGARAVVGSDPSLAHRTPHLPFLLVPSSEGAPHLPYRYADHAPLLVLYTSGTTGAPKGAVLSAHNIASNLDALASAWGWTAQDTVVHALPLFHVHGLCLGLFGSVRRGGAFSWLPKFEPEALAARVAEEARDRNAVLFAVPTMYRRLAESAEKSPKIAQNLQAARLLVSGSAALPASEHARMQALTGHAIVERYGLTETLIIASTRHDGARVPGTVGTPLSGVEVKLVDEDRRPLTHDDPSAIGEVAVRGPSVFAGYLDRDDATAAVRDAEGWFYTGDLATQNHDGVLRIVGRRSTDLIKTGGFKVGAGEVETAILSHPAIRECAVLGEEDADLGERIVACIVVHEGMDAPSLEEVGNFVAASLAPHKRPRALRVLSELPRNAMGKVQKARLKA